EKHVLVLIRSMLAHLAADGRQAVGYLHPPERKRSVPARCWLEGHGGSEAPPSLGEQSRRRRYPTTRPRYLPPAKIKVGSSMTSALDQKGLASVQREFSHVPPGLVEHIIRAYLSTVIPAEIAGVVEELRKRAASHEAIRKMDKNAFCEQADISLAREAATLIERLAASQADL